MPLDAYDLAGVAWHVTISVARGNAAPFHDIPLGQALLAGFVNACQSDDAIVHLICLMPDHLHALIEVQSEGLVKIVGRAKSMTTRMWWTNGRQGTLWQKSFYDHGIRETHDFEATVKYILENPVRAGLVEEGETYPLIAGRLIAER